MQLPPLSFHVLLIMQFCSEQKMTHDTCNFFKFIFFDWEQNLEFFSPLMKFFSFCLYLMKWCFDFAKTFCCKTTIQPHWWNHLAVYSCLVDRLGTFYIFFCWSLDVASIHNIKCNVMKWPQNPPCSPLLCGLSTSVRLSYKMSYSLQPLCWLFRKGLWLHGHF